MPSSAAPTVLISHPMLWRMDELLAAEGWRTARRWELTPEQRPVVRAVVHAGEIPLDPDFLLGLPNLGLIACVPVGYDGVDVAWCRAHGIEVTHAHAINAEDVADHAMGLVIGAWRNIVAGDRLVRAGGWTESQRVPTRPSLGGRRLGVVGLGAIGEALARRAEAFRLQVAWWGPHAKPAPWPRAESLLALARDSDILVVACRADDSNRGLISAEVIEAVGPLGMIVNVARGSLVDEDALIAALKAGRLGRAALDVFEVEPTPPARWAELPNTVLTPHTAGATLETIPAMLAQAVENVRLFLAGQPVASPIVL